jgi:hypothetical protein
MLVPRGNLVYGISTLGVFTVLCRPLERSLGRRATANEEARSH